MKTGLRKLLRDTRGGTAIEYGLILALVVMAAFLGISNFARTAINMWNNTSAEVQKH